jgi:hypothetical protein
MFLAVDCQVTVVPVLTQNKGLPFAFGMLGVAVAEFDVRFTSIVHAAEAEPQVLLALHWLAGWGSVQAYLLTFFDWAAAEMDSSNKPRKNKLQHHPQDR